MDKVPEAGYKIIGLPVAGFVRKLSTQNIKVVAKLFKSLMRSRKIIKDFKPDVVIGVGGYASGPVLYMASRQKIPTLIQEQNSYAGVTNKILAKKAAKICVAYDGMDAFFEKDKILFTGNPVRQDLINIESKKEEALTHFNLKSDKPTILIVGGSGGARTINQSVLKHWDELQQSGVQLIWQTGKYYFESVTEQTKEKSCDNIQIMPFISRMDYAYAAADLVISRAGAGTISELSLVKKPVLLIPSPNVAEDHQTKNAMALVKKQAAILIKDIEAKENLIKTVLELVQNTEQLNILSKNIATMAMPESATLIAQEVFKLINQNN